MEGLQNVEQREAQIYKLINDLAGREGMNADEILSDLTTFAPYEENDDPNPDYIEQVAEMLGISKEEMTLYAIKKAGEYLEE
jgi:hypothetical protein